MGQKKKQGKERLDKYYHLAKTQGYRARSAFKLIQLNKKFNFLENARVLIDLCAAPGGWLQVASKYMPVSSVIVGVDLAPIKPIPRVITHVEDITTDKCRSTLRKDLKDWKADVVLHDGAPNVGTAWLQDAYSQSELVLASLRLAVEFLAKGGTFVTKVFRSKDYNSLMWVFNQLFKNVEATKPPSSRNVSAEIFVVCRDFLAPKKLDPKFLDPRFVFKDLDVEANDAAQQKASLNDLLNPEKAAKRRHREGYEDGDYTLYHEASVLDFIRLPKESEAVTMLVKLNSINFKVGDKSDADQMETDESQLDDETMLKAITKDPSTDAEIKTCFADLKVLGRKDYKNLLRWRLALRVKLGLEKPKEIKEKTEEAETEEVDVEQELEALSKDAVVSAKKAKRKRSERLAKDRRRMQLNMTTPTDIGLESSAAQFADDAIAVDGEASAPGNAELFELRQTKRQTSAAALEDAMNQAGSDADETDQSDDYAFSTDEDASGLEDGENGHVDYLNEVAEEDYEQYLQRQMSKDSKARIRMLRAKEKEFTGFGDAPKSESEESEEEEVVDYRESSSSDSDGDSVVVKQSAPIVKAAEDKPASKKAKLWFSQSVFDGVDMDDAEDEPIDSMDVDSDQDVIEDAESRSDVSQQDDVDEAFESEDDAKASGFTVDPREALSTAEAVTLAMRMVQDGRRNANDLVDAHGYHRYAFNDDPAALPKWFLDDEVKHNKPQLPISKEAVDRMRQRQKELDARPIKKVMEAKARKKYKAVRKLEKLRTKMNNMLEDGANGEEDPEMGAKLGQINKIMKNAVNKAKSSTRRKVAVVVAKGVNRGQAGRPKGVKGRYKMVDPRMKKEVRAERRQKKQQKKRK